MPDDFLEPLTDGPFSKLEIGQSRLAYIVDYDAAVLKVHRLVHRSGSNTDDD